jgi:sodium transport system permease protein
VLNLASMAITLMQILRLAAQNVVVEIPWGHALLSSLVIFPAALLFAAAFVALGATARTFKEAQTLLLPVYFLTVAPAMAGAIGEYPLTGIVTWIPGMNITLLARDLLVGRATWSGGLATLASTLLLSAAALAAAARIYDSERLVAPTTRRRQRVPGAPARTTSAGDALVLFALAFLLLYFVFLPIEQRHLASGLLIAEWLGLFGLVWLFARTSGQTFRMALGYSPPRPRAVLGAALAGCSAWAAVAIFSEWLLPVPRQMLEELRKSLIPLDGSRGFVATLLLVAVSPAICEECLFRGPILRGLRTRLDSATTVVITAFLFGLFHMDAYRLIPTTILGVLLGFIALESGSIVPAMVAHFCNNAMLVTLASLRLDRSMETLSHRALTLIVIASVGLTGAGVALVRGTRRRPEV